MNTFQLPKYPEVSPLNQQYFNFFVEHLGSLPNLYAMLAHSDNALDAYLRLHNHQLSLTIPEKEIIALIVSSVNESKYCLETHTMIARLNGFNEEEIMEIKNGSAKFDDRYHALAKLVYSIVITKGHPENKFMQIFFAVGYTKENLTDTFICVGDNVITNLLTCSMQVPSDFSSTDLE
jgi:AhpD family alkylhydroperoxidase